MINIEFTSNIQRIVFKSGFAIIIASVLLWFSLFLYAILYYLYIPAIAHVKPVHLLYDTVCTKGERCKNPYANVSLTENNDYDLLTRGQGYAIELVLDMPESERNLNQGMFMVRLDMISEKGKVLMSSRRPAILRYRSFLFKTVYTLFYMPALLLGSTEEKQSLHVPLFEQYVEYDPTYFVYIEIEAGTAEIYSSSLKIHAQFTGLRYMMYYWPVLSLVIGVGSNFFFLSSIALFIWMRHGMNGSQDFINHRLSPSEQDAAEEIKRVLRQRQRETQKSPGSKTERKINIPTDPYVVETISPHKNMDPIRFDTDVGLNITISNCVFNQKVDISSCSMKNTEKHGNCTPVEEQTQEIKKETTNT